LCFLKEGYRTGQLSAFSKRGTGQINFVLPQSGVKDRSSLCFLEEGYRTGRYCAFTKRGTSQDRSFLCFLEEGYRTGHLCAFSKRGTIQERSSLCFFEEGYRTDRLCLLSIQEVAGLILSNTPNPSPPATSSLNQLKRTEPYTDNLWIFLLQL
jgi:hypothetical protein